MKLTLKRRVLEIACELEPDSGKPITSCVPHLAPQRIYDYVEAHPDCERASVKKAVTGKATAIVQAIDLMLGDGRLVEAKGALRVSGQAWSNRFFCKPSLSY